MIQTEKTGNTAITVTMKSTTLPTCQSMYMTLFQCTRANQFISSANIIYCVGFCFTSVQKINIWWSLRKSFVSSNSKVTHKMITEFFEFFYTKSMWRYSKNELFWCFRQSSKIYCLFTSKVLPLLNSSSNPIIILPFLTGMAVYTQNKKKGFYLPFICQHTVNKPFLRVTSTLFSSWPVVTPLQKWVEITLKQVNIMIRLLD